MDDKRFSTLEKTVPTIREGKLVFGSQKHNLLFSRENKIRLPLIAVLHRYFAGYLLLQIFITGFNCYSISIFCEINASGNICVKKFLRQEIFASVNKEGNNYLLSQIFKIFSCICGNMVAFPCVCNIAGGNLRQSKKSMQVAVGLPHGNPFFPDAGCSFLPMLFQIRLHKKCKTGIVYQYPDPDRRFG